MSGILNKVLNFVGFETELDEEMEEYNNAESAEKYEHIQIQQASAPRKQQGKVVNLHTQGQLKVVVVQPEKFDEAQDICDHLKSKKPIVVNLENVDKDEAQRIVDFLSGSVYALDGNIQKVAASIFLITPNNVDILGDFKDDFKSKGVFPWMK